MITFKEQKDIFNVTNNTKRRKRKIIWFNQPYSLNVLTNSGKKFFSLPDKLKARKLHKLLHLNNVKVRYSSLPNFKIVIKCNIKNI